MIIRTLRAADIDAVVEFSVRAWRPVFESFMQVMRPDVFQRLCPHWEAAQAAAVRDACQAEKNRTWAAEAQSLRTGAADTQPPPCQITARSAERR